jgi:hypothetical protein
VVAAGDSARPAGAGSAVVSSPLCAGGDGREAGTSARGTPAPGTGAGDVPETPRSGTPAPAEDVAPGCRTGPATGVGETAAGEAGAGRTGEVPAPAGAEAAAAGFPSRAAGVGTGSISGVAPCREAVGTSAPLAVAPPSVAPREVACAPPSVTEGVPWPGRAVTPGTASAGDGCPSFAAAGGVDAGPAVGAPADGCSPRAATPPSPAPATGPPRCGPVDGGAGVEPCPPVDGTASEAGAPVRGAADCVVLGAPAEIGVTAGIAAAGGVAAAIGRPVPSAGRAGSPPPATGTGLPDGLPTTG